MKHRLVNPAFQARKNAKIIFFVVAFLLLSALLKIYSDVFSKNVSLKYANGKTYLLVHSHSSLTGLFNDMEKGYYLDNLESFKRLARLLKLEERMKPGRYLLKAGMSNFEVVKMLINGRQEPVDVVLKYAERPEDLSAFFASQLEIDSAAFLKLIKDTSLIHPMGFDANTIMGMFIPNTYNFYWNTNSVALLDRMNKEYKKFWNAKRISQALEMGFTQNQVSTLASIVQKESNKGDEMPVIAGVYINRLNKGMPLQADPTVIFAWNDHTIKRVTNIHTAIVSPYNTYLNTGLPPGPICTPSIQAIDAVLQYQTHNYLYFCAREDFSGYHAFANSFEQHQENARKYQRALNQLNIQ